ncbi:MAG: hypothetical protein WCK51_10455 [Armatimonadota bacterium]
MIANDTTIAEARLDLLRRAALAGPGYRGTRNEVSEATRLALVAEFRDQGLQAPAYLTHPTSWVERRAKLFEAGDYPDKGVSVSTENLQAIATNFDLPVPVLIEHGDSPLHLGFLIAVDADGANLTGLIALTSEADQLLIQSGAQSLSVGLERDLEHIREVSVVRNPRIESARLFDTRPLFSSGFADVDYAKLAHQAQVESRKREAGSRVEEFVNRGQLAPRQAKIATLLFACDAEVNGQPVADLVNQLLEDFPKSNIFSQQAPAAADHESALNLLLPEESAFYRRHFPGVDLSEIAKRR